VGEFNFHIALHVSEGSNFHHAADGVLACFQVRDDEHLSGFGGVSDFGRRDLPDSDRSLAYPSGVLRVGSRHANHRRKGLHQGLHGFQRGPVPAAFGSGLR